MRTNRLTKLTIVTAAVLMSTASVAVAASSAGRKAPSGPEPEATSHLEHARVSGAAHLDFVDPRDDVRFRVDAHGLFDPASPSPASVRAWGTARIHHHVAELDVTWWAKGRIDCLSVGGRSATGSMIVKTASPELQEAGWIGQRIGFSVDAGGLTERARVGWTGPIAPEDLPPCLAPAPTMAALAGGFYVGEGRR
jgi:hypothetical protein